MNKYQEADMVMLHDAGVVLRRVGYSEGLVGWGSADEEFAAQTQGGILLNGAEMIDLLQLFRPTGRIASEVRTYEGDHYTEASPELLSFSLHDVGRWQIESLLVQKNGETLDLCLVVSYPERDGVAFCRLMLTYTGRSTVWWRVYVPQDTFFVDAARNKMSAEEIANAITVLTAHLE